MCWVEKILFYTDVPYSDKNEWIDCIRQWYKDNKGEHIQNVLEYNQK
jgi:hypothetical protein